VRGFGFGPGFILGTDADFDGPAFGLGFGPGFIFGTDADVLFLKPLALGVDVDCCFLNPAICET
jgi:hypothetical protein